MNLRRAARYMGCPQPDERVWALLKRGEAVVWEAAQPRHVIRRLGAKDFPLPGEAVRRHLAGCREMLLIAATLGAGMDCVVKTTVLMQEWISASAGKASWIWPWGWP